MEEWQWPVVEELFKSLTFQEDDDELLLFDARARMSKYIIDNILGDNPDDHREIPCSSSRESFHQHQKSLVAPRVAASVTLKSSWSSSSSWSYAVFPGSLGPSHIRPDQNRDTSGIPHFGRKGFSVSKNKGL